MCARARARRQAPRETHFTLQSLHSLPHDTHVLVVAHWDWPRKGTRHAGAPGGLVVINWCAGECACGGPRRLESK